MKIKTINKEAQEPVGLEGASRVRMRMLIGPSEQAGNFHMRHFEVEPGGHTPHHQHPYEHEILVLAGKGVARGEDGDVEIGAGQVIWVPADEPHQFRNAGDDPFELICLIPAQDQ
jgi:quercetin dioxygenase-like cupin family protein